MAYQPQQQLDFFNGDSEMHARMRTYDWSASPVGPPCDWPQALRIIVELILASKFPMCVAWGRELAFLYNDAYAAILGKRHPAALGRRVQEVWADVWPAIHPLIERALAGKTSFSENQPLKMGRNGYQEYAWFTFSYSPVRDDSGAIVGVYCACTETTENVLNERRQAFRIQLEDRLRHLTTDIDIMRVSAEMLGQYLRASRAGFAAIEPDGKTLRFDCDWTNGKTSSLAGQRFALDDFRPGLITQLKAGHTVLTEDSVAYGVVSGAGNPGSYVDIDARAGITVPLIQDGEFTVAMYVHDIAPRVWRPDEQALTREIAERAWDAIKRARAEATQRESEERFRNMADHAPVMIWTTDLNGYCTYLNRAWHEFTGQSETEALGRGWLDAVSAEDRPLVEQEQKVCNAARKPIRIEYRLRRRDGSWRWVMDSAAPRFDPDGAYLGYVGSVVDIDELKKAEAALKASNARFRAAIDAVEGVLWTSDAHGRMAGEQPGWATLTGQSFEEYRGDGWSNAIHPDDVKPTMRTWKQAVAERKTYVWEHRLRRRDGEWRHYSIRAIPALGADGEVREWIGVHTDITELRRTEEALRQLNARLAIGIEERTRERDRLWRMSHDIMAIASLNGYFLSVNPAFTAALGWSEEEATSVPLSELTHPDHRGELAAKMAVLAQGKSLPRYEVRDLHKDGSFRWLSWTIVPEGDLLYGVARDVTLEKEQAAALRHAEEALKQSQKMEAVGQLTGGIAHDFNNLLASIVSNLELMKMRMAAGETAGLDRYVDGAMAVAERAASLTHRLLAFSRRQTLAPRLVNVNQLVEFMAELIQRTVGPSVQVVTALSEDIWNTRCDPNQLESALLNLAINARDAMPEGGRLTIATGNLTLGDAYAAEYPDVTPGEYVAISVIDNGTGMTAEVAARAFDPFFTTKPLGQGTGLGLSTIYGFVKQSGGHIRLYSEPGKGTTVRLKLPRHFGDADAGAAEQSRPEPSQAKTQATLLIVDDEAPLRSLLAEMMEMLGYATVQAANAQEALRIIDSAQPVDLLVTDVGLPGGMNGKQLVDAARALRPRLKILFITGYAADAAMRNGFLDHDMQVMTKPFVIDTFTAKVRAMLEE